MKTVKSVLETVLPAPVVMHMRALDHYLNGEPELRLLKNLVDSGRAAVDAGANIGTYSYFLRKYASSVFAYEPNPELARRLAATLPTVQVRQVALSDFEGELLFTVPVAMDGRAAHELGSVAQQFDGCVEQFGVRCVTLDSENLSDVGFIKIDVEQHERQVLRGSLKTIDESRPVMLVEVYPLKYQNSVSDEFAFILERNYTAWFSFAGKWQPIVEFRSDVHASPERFGDNSGFMGNNLIFFPSEHPRALLGPVADL